MVAQLRARHEVVDDDAPSVGGRGRGHLDAPDAVEQDGGDARRVVVREDERALGEVDVDVVEVPLRGGEGSLEVFFLE